MPVAKQEVSSDSVAAIIQTTAAIAPFCLQHLLGTDQQLADVTVTDALVVVS